MGPPGDLSGKSLNLLNMRSTPVRISVKPGAPGGSLQGRVVVETNSPQFPAASVTFSGFVR